MYSRIRLATLLLAVTACSQRAPWRVVPDPAPASGAASSATAQPQGDGDSRRSLPALATAARLPADATAVAPLHALAFPVAGYEGDRLDDSFNAPRDGGARRHRAIDIMAPRGTPVLSVADGRILRLGNGGKGGITVYATDESKRFVFYYAHLDRHHPNLYTGKPLVRGDTLGYVGTTGNAPENVPHLHFQLMRMPTHSRYWDGEPINPYPFLTQSLGAITADGQ